MADCETLRLAPRDDLRDLHSQSLQLELRILAKRLNRLLVWTPSTTEGFSAKKWESYLVDIAVLASQEALDEARRRFRLDVKSMEESRTPQEERNG